MAKDKAGKVVIKKDESKKSKKALKTTKESGLSAERVVDSESERETKDVKPHRKESKDMEEKQIKKKKKVAAPPPPPKEPTLSESSDEEEADSDEEMPDAPVVPKKPQTIPAKVNGVKRKAEEESSLDDGQSSDEEESDEPAKPEAKRVKVSAAKDETSGEDEETNTKESADKVRKAPATDGKAKPAAEGDADSDESSEESSDEESSSEASETPQKPSKPTAKASTTPAANMSQTKAVPAREYKAPQGYSAASVTSSMLSAGGLKGKQIWTVTVPSTVSIKTLKEVTLDAIQSGASVLEHNGINYKLSEDKSRSSEFDTAVIPSTKSYDPVSQTVAKKLVLQRRVELPNLSAKQADTTTGSKAAADVATPSISTARPQPKGMRMRYKPPGFGNGDPGLGSDTDEENTRPARKDKSFQFPKALGAHGASDKPDVETKVKKSKKKQKSGDVDMVNGDLHTVAPDLKLAKTLSKESVESREGLNKEERRKRKEEKRARKEAKGKAGA